LIPQSTPSNAHPPLVMGYLALCWKLFGFSPPVTRTAMLVVAAFALTGLFQLAQLLAGRAVAMAATLCTAVYPVFFVQSSLAQVDLAAAGLLFWGLCAYFEERMWAALVWFSLAALAKETAVLVPLALFTYELAQCVWPRLSERDRPRGPRRAIYCLIPAVPLVIWYTYHYHQTGFVFGNPEFLRYNLQGTLHPLRIALALLLRTWQALGYLNLFVLTGAALLAIAVASSQPHEREGLLNRKWVRLALLAVIGMYVLSMSVLGGAVLARYMLPITPLVIVAGFDVLRRRVRLWQWLVPAVAASFVIGLFSRPPYGISLEDNLAYRTYILLHERGEGYLQEHYPGAHVLTAWPATDELTQPYLGYVPRSTRVVGIEDFTVEQLVPAASRQDFDVALVFSTKLVPSYELFGRLSLWREWKARYFGFHSDLAPAAAADVLGGKVVFSSVEGGQWISLIERPQAMEARRASFPGASGGKSASLE
jgi:hypothetical protein